MNESHETIERELRAMSEWEGETPQLWRRALKDDAPAKPAARPWHTRRWVAPAFTAAALLVISIGIFAPTLDGSRSGGSATPEAPQFMAPDASADDAAGYFKSLDGLRDKGVGAELRYRVPSLAVDRASAQPERGAERAVVRKATIEITTPDVRAAALRARQLLSEPRGEYVESADIDESDADHPRADLVLCVEASRLEEVVSQLRELGEVGAEHLDGEDVTDQMVDLGARLENERRVEAELAELLKKRENDTLEDILAVRREFGSVRERIERLAAQQDNLARMVRLARVAVMLRTEVKPSEPAPKKGVWDGFVESLGVAWSEGLAALLGTVAGFVRVVVGGAIWFALAALAIALAWRRWRAEHPRALAEAA